MITSENRAMFAQMSDDQRYGKTLADVSNFVKAVIDIIPDNYTVSQRFDVLKVIINNLISGKDLDKLESKLSNFNSDTKMDHLDKLYADPIAYIKENGMGELKLYDLAKKNACGKIASELDFIPKEWVNVDHYTADPSILSNSMEGLTRELRYVSSRDCQRVNEDLHQSMKKLFHSMRMKKEDIQIVASDFMQGYCTKRITEPCIKIKSKEKKSKKYHKGIRYEFEVHFYSPIDRLNKKMSKCKLSSAIITVEMNRKGFVYKSLAQKLAFLEFRIIVGSGINVDNYCKSDDYLMTELHDVIRDPKSMVIL